MKLTDIHPINGSRGVLQGRLEPATASARLKACSSRLVTASLELSKRMRRIDALAVTRSRTAEERARRHLQGDKGATFSKGKYMTLRKGYMGTVTTLSSKDCLLAEIYET